MFKMCSICKGTLASFIDSHAKESMDKEKPAYCHGCMRLQK